jgi:hypothetical protein
MAIAFDATSAGGTATAASLTFAHTCTGSNRILFVTVNHTLSNAISGITYNGVALTKIGSEVNSGFNTHLSLWYLLNPATGANNIVVTPNTNSEISAASASYTGALQSGQPDANSAGTPATTTSYSQSVTTVLDNCWAVLGGIAASSSALTAGANTAIRQQPEGAHYGTFLIDTNSAKTPVGTDTMNVTSASQGFDGIMASFAPAASVIGLATKKLLVGVGI